LTFEVVALVGVVRFVVVVSLVFPLPVAFLFLGYHFLVAAVCLPLRLFSFLFVQLV
jgi:hypothetical protein